MHGVRARKATVCQVDKISKPFIGYLYESKILIERERRKRFSATMAENVRVLCIFTSWAAYIYRRPHSLIIE